MIQKHTYSIDEFCRLHNIGRTTFYGLVKEGKGPAIMKVGRRTLITVEAAQNWRNGFAQRTDSKEVI